MSYTIIQELIETQLATVTGLPYLQKENTRYAPKVGTQWARLTLLPNEVIALSTASDLANGLVQIDVYYPIDKGVKNASEMADSIRGSFYRGLLLKDDDSGLAVSIEKSWREVARDTENFIQIPVLVRWMAQTPKT